MGQWQLPVFVGIQNYSFVIVKNIVLFIDWAIRGLFSLLSFQYSRQYLKFANDWIRTTHFAVLEALLFQLSHNHWPMFIINYLVVLWTQSVGKIVLLSEATMYIIEWVK